MITPQSLRFALNHMTVPQFSLPEFFALASRLGIAEVEIRNDIEGQPILDGTLAADIRLMAKDAGVRIITINALQRFNEWNATRAEEAKALVRYAAECGSGGLVLVPKNDGTGCADGERQANVWTALKGIRRILDDSGVTGLVEALGFKISSLRSKREAVEAIHDIDGAKTFRLTHDTFHHHLSGEPELFPEMTGLVHISGVRNPDVSIEDMRDPHRVLVDAHDRLGNVEQIAALRRAGYAGPYSYEPFADELRHLTDPAAAIKASMTFIETELSAMAA
jgi:2-keto-myo-inositol isomerase